MSVNDWILGIGLEPALVARYKELFKEQEIYSMR